jgi:hypothetical protein
MPNLIMGDSERAVGKSKKWDEFLKPKSEPLPNRISERRLPEVKGSFVVQGLLPRDDVLYYWNRPKGDLKRNAKRPQKGPLLIDY